MPSYKVENIPMNLNSAGLRLEVDEHSLDAYVSFFGWYTLQVLYLEQNAFNLVQDYVKALCHWYRLLDLFDTLKPSSFYPTFKYAVTEFEGTSC